MTVASSTLTFGKGPQQPGSPRQRIEEAAVDLFAQQGFMATTIRHITAAVGLTPGALYNHFPSKEQLLFSIIKATADALARELDNALAKAEGRDPAEQLSSFIHAYVLFHCRFQKEAKVALRDYEYLPEPMLHEILSIRRDLRRTIETMLENGIAAGAFELTATGEMPAKRAAAMAIMDMCVRSIEPYWLESQLSANQIAQVHTDFALRLVLARN